MLSTISNISSETTGPIEVKFHMESPWDGETKDCSNGPGHMTKMAAMPIYGKNLQKSSPPESKGQWPWNLVCIIGCSSTTKCSNDDPGLTLTYFMARSYLVLYAFVWEKGKTMDFLETIVVYDLKLATDDRSDKKFLLTSNLCSLSAVCPLFRGYIHVLNHEIKLYKIRLQRDFFETCKKWVKW